MKIDSVANANEASIGHTRLSLSGEMGRISCHDNEFLSITEMKQPQISNPDILRSICGFVAQGETDFDHIKKLTQGSFFENALGISPHTICRNLHTFRPLESNKASPRILRPESNDPHLAEHILHPPV